MHESGADGSNESLLLDDPLREGDQHVTAGGRLRDTEIPCLDCRVSGIREHAHRATNRGLDLLQRHTVLLAFLAVARIPVEASDSLTDRNELANVCTNVHA